MTFILRKIVSTLLLPVSLGLLLLIGGTIFLFTKKQKFGKFLVTTGVLLLFLLSFPPVARYLTDSLESKFSPVTTANSDQKISWIVVLGGGHNSSRPEGLQLSSSSLARVIEGVRIYRMSPGRKLLLSGGGVYDPLPNANAMRTEAKILGVPDTDIILEPYSKDTEEEAKLLAPILKQEKFYLVTSAVHMTRAFALFRKQKTNPVAAPSDYSFEARNAPLMIRLLPSATSLQQSERALREYLGIAWSRLRSKADMER